METNSKHMANYPDNILEQPAAVRATAANLADEHEFAVWAAQLANGQFRQIVLTGMGASYAALHPLTLQLVTLGIPAQRIETSELLYHAPRLLDEQTLVIAASQSGASAEILRLFERTRPEHIPLIGVTNTPESLLAQASDLVVLTTAGAEHSVSSKTYVAMLAALHLLGTALCGQHYSTAQRELMETADAMERYLAQRDEYVSALTELLAPIRHVVLTGRGASLAAVGAGSLIIQEAAHFACLGMSSASFRHGPLELIAPDLFVLVYHGAAPTQELNARLASDIRAAGGQSALVEEADEVGIFKLPLVSDATLPLMEILVPEMFSLALAQLGGLNAGQFARGTKVTTTE